MKKALIIIITLLSNLVPVYSQESINFTLNNNLNLEMIKCPTGDYLMGSNQNELGYNKNNELNKTEVNIKNDFYIGKYEITQKQYLSIMGDNPSKNKEENNPVERVTYYNAIEFCNKLNEITKNQRPSGYEFTLPTEMQWEYACRAGTSSSLNNGKDLSQINGSSDELNEIAWYKANSDSKTHAVGTKKCNNWGIYDMHGNVAEWCIDAFIGNEQAKSVTNEAKCAIRGGAYFYEPNKLRSSSRGANAPNTLSSGFGFRVALVKNIEDNEKKEEVVIEKKKEPLQAPILKAGEKISVSVNGVKFPLIACPAGEFDMGSLENEAGRANNESISKKIIEQGFYIGKYEITQGQYKAIMGNNPSITTGDKLPVHNINWLDAEKFCQKLNELTKDKRPTNYEFALPTEVQWEYACRSGYKSSLNNGQNLKNTSNSDTELNKLGWYDANACGKVQTVGKKIANAWGLHDMLGNVCEWCADSVGQSQNDENKLRIIRGGGFKSKASSCRCAKRDEVKENKTDEEYGLRVVLIFKN